MKQIVWALGLLLVGCATHGEVQSRPLADGATRAYSSPVETVTNAVRSAIHDVGLNLKSEKRDGNNVIVMADRGATAWSWGEIVRVAIIPADGKTLVRIVNERVYAMNATSKDFTEDLFTHIGQRLHEYPR